MFRRAARWAGSTALAVALAIVTLHTRSLLITSDSEAAAWRLGQALAGYGGAEALPLDRAMLQGWRAAADAQAGGGNPVVLVPPLLGTALEMQLERKPSVPHFWCRRSFSWRLAWLNPRMLLPWSFDCFADNFRVECEDGRGQGPRCSEPPGVSVRPRPGFDSVISVLPGGGPQYATGFARLAAVLQLLGWVKDQNLLAHRYDWRLPPSEHLAAGGSFEDLKDLIEGAVEQAGRPVIGISLSLGSPYFALFLRQMSPEWRERHVAGHIAVSGAWGGSLVAPLAAISGSLGNSGETEAGRSALRRLAAGLPAVAWLAPSEAVFGSDQVLVEDEATGARYAAADLGQLLRDAGVGQLAAAWEAARPAMQDLPSPNVTLYCLYSLGVDTVARMRYASSPAEGAQPALEFGDGDGTVPRASLAVCDGWRREARGRGGEGAAHRRVHVRRYWGLQHAALLGDQGALGDVVGAVLALGAAAPPRGTS